MRTFIEDYLQDPSQAIENARQSASGSWYDDIDEDMIYAQIASAEFRLYETVTLAPSYDESSAHTRVTA